MLSQFQQALADLVASPDLCNEVRRSPMSLCARYELTDRERKRLVHVVNQAGMACNCMLYRANRLAPIAINLPRMCSELGGALAPLLHRFWREHPAQQPHFVLEARAFGLFLLSTEDAAAKQSRALVQAALVELNDKLRDAGYYD
jgi:hypothetical protein